MDEQHPDHASSVPGPDYDASTKSWYRDGLASQDFILGDMYFDEDSKSYVVGASGVLKDRDGSVRGVAAADVYLDSISKIVSGIQIEDTGGIFLVDTRTDTIIGHRDSQITGSKLGDLTDELYAYASRQISAGKTGLSLNGGTYVQIAQVPGSDWTAVAYVSQVEVLAGHISSVSESVRLIAQGAQRASQLSQNVKDGLTQSSGKMQDLTENIQKISDRSTEIHRVVKIIEDIAFQTNILALNAAVEAAQAGEARKGFAVVADEVRMLAGKSSAAAKETTMLLGQTVDSMEEGARAAQDTSESMLAVVAHAEEMGKLIHGIADYTQQQSANAQEITQGIEQISSVVQTNVATAETSAAASEELSGQAAMLKQLVSKFRLKNP